MPIAPGKYDKLAEHCLAEAQAEMVAVIVIGGTLGAGMSVKEQGTVWEIATRTPGNLGKLARAMRSMADEIEKEAHALGG
jgi:hypothetical protein